MPSGFQLQNTVYEIDQTSIEKETVQTSIEKELIEEKISSSNDQNIKLTPLQKSAPKSLYNEFHNFLSNFESISQAELVTQFISLSEKFGNSIKTKYDINNKENFSNQNLEEILMGSKIETTTYDLKDLKHAKDHKINEKSHFINFIIQNLLILIGKSISTISEEKILENDLESLQQYQNPNCLLHSFYLKLIEIMSKGSNNISEINYSDLPGQDRVSNHYGLLGILFNHSILYLERKLMKKDIQELFSSKVLSKKNCLKDLKTSSMYVFNKMMNNGIKIDSYIDLLDFLGGINLLLSFEKGKLLKIKFYKVLKGFYSNRKFENTCHQIIAPLILNYIENLK